MSKHEIKIPKMGQSTVEVDLINWLVEEGQRVAAGAILAEIESEKATVEIESDVAGTVSEIRVRAGDTTEVGATICVIDTD
ncbi:MAG: hypothetical protein M0R28_06180 [Pigmentiphaga sp.]|nr:hypothetical protein [Pigmentiphaga sp.]